MARICSHNNCMYGRCQWKNPGITCYWQIQPNRNDISFKEWMKLDLKYIDNWSLWVDTKIIFRTVWVMLTGSGR